MPGLSGDFPGTLSEKRSFWQLKSGKAAQQIGLAGFDKLTTFQKVKNGLYGRKCRNCNLLCIFKETKRKRRR